MTLNIFHEPYSDVFEKWHLNSPHCPSPSIPEDCRPVIHRLDVDRGAPHDHPWGFHTFCLRGGYEEEHFYVEDGVWKMQLRQLVPGEARYVPFNHVHRVVRLLDGPCFTCVLYGPHEREWRYYPDALDCLVGAT